MSNEIVVLELLNGYDEIFSLSKPILDALK
jgi:hypothetical protein